MNKDGLLGISRRILDEVSRVVVGKEEVKELLLVALLSRGHVLIEGLPGTAKTTLARTFAQAIGGEFKRIQFVPDMLPADVCGFYLYTPDGGSRFVPGPVFANVVLADELNRTTPRTQAALLEAMQEGQVSIEGHTYPLAQPYMVIASQTPFGSEGTYPLSDIQADRFMFRAWSGHPTLEEEQRVLGAIDFLEEPSVSAVVSPEEILQLRKAVQAVHVSPKVVDYLLGVVDRVRHNSDVLAAPSTRASIALYKGCRSLALLDGRDYAIPDDVQRLLLPALVHRIRLKSEAGMEQVTVEGVVRECLEKVAVPKEL